MSPAPALAHQRARHRLHVLLEQAADIPHAPELVFEAVDIVVPDGLLIPYLAVVDAGIDLSAVAVHARDVLAVVEIAPPSTRLADRKWRCAAGGRARTRLNETRTETRARFSLSLITVGKGASGRRAQRLALSSDPPGGGLPSPADDVVWLPSSKDGTVGFPRGEDDVAGGRHGRGRGPYR
jgi:hypothetical protein